MHCMHIKITNNKKYHYQSNSTLKEESPILKQATLHYMLHLRLHLIGASCNSKQLGSTGKRSLISRPIESK